MDVVDLPSVASVGRGAGWLRRFGRSRVSFDSHDVIMAARSVARLEDLGTSGFRRRLDVMLDQWQPNASAARTSAHPEVRNWLAAIVVRRAQLVDRAKKRPQLAAAALHPPIVVVGLPGAPLQSTSDELRRRHPDVASVADSTDLDLATPGFEVSMYGLSFVRYLGVDLPHPDDAEMEEIYRLHRLQVAATGRATERPWLTGGADHLLARTGLEAAYPDATIVEARIDATEAVNASMATERDHAHRFARQFDASAARRRWELLVDQAQHQLEQARHGELSMMTLDEFSKDFSR